MVASACCVGGSCAWSVLGKGGLKFSFLRREALVVGGVLRFLGPLVLGWVRVVGREGALVVICSPVRIAPGVLYM